MTDYLEPWDINKAFVGRHDTIMTRIGFANGAFAFMTVSAISLTAILSYMHPVRKTGDECGIETSNHHREHAAGAEGSARRALVP
jgi:hypothetical protein